MAVAQGYGKTSSSGLVFAYDTGDTINSYVGEPTANLIPSPTINALPTTGNSWGTYNTNQYCGNNGCNVYWDIPSISSVSNNIITTSAAHGIRTYDVINPQSTGGGVTAGTQYFAKKISDTQFTLHAYNSSQDGSQGYINPTTGTFKVYDSVALDQRISVNSSSFPTKWFGNAHQPNSGLVKEIITNGYKDKYTGKLTDCMRIHIPRTDGVDGMAYGADAPVTIGQSVTTSFWMRSVSATAVGRNVYFQHYNYGGVGGADVFAFNATLGPVGEWRQYTMTFTPTHSTLISYWFPDGGYIYDFDLANIQIEQKGHVTPFIAGTRSNTQGLLPLVGASSLDLSNMSYDSSANMVFDGASNYFTIPYSSVLDTPNGCTYEMIIYPTGAGEIINRGTNDGNDNPRIYLYSNGIVYFDWSSGGTDRNVTSSTGLTMNAWNHLICTATPGSSLKVYKNTVEIASGTTQPTPLPNTSNNIEVGRVSWIPRYGAGKLSVLKIYNRALTPAEIDRNYRHYKTRFNLS